MNSTHKKRKEPEKHGKEALNKLMNNAIYDKTMENLRNRTDLKLVINEKDYLIITSKPSYMSHIIRKSKFSIKLNKHAYIRMYILEFSKVLMYEFHYVYIKNKCDTSQNYYSQALIV